MRNNEVPVRSLLVVAILTMMMSAVGVTGAGAEAIDTSTNKSSDFENGQISPFSICTTQNPNYGRVETAHGTKAMKFFWTQTGYDGTRMDRGAEACSGLNVYKEGWYGFKFLLPSAGFPRNKTTIIGQIFNNGGCSSWAGTLMVQNNELWLEYRGNCGTTSVTRVRLDSNIPRDTWRPISIHYVISKANAGRMEVWYNGAPKSTPTYRATNINFASWGQYTGDELAKVANNHIGLKFGLYCADPANYTAGETRTIYYDNLAQLLGNPSNAFDVVDPR